MFLSMYIYPIRVRLVYSPLLKSVAEIFDTKVPYTYVLLIRQEKMRQNWRGKCELYKKKSYLNY